jgi:methylmalonyl-CoA/ethylmalonyl-CoA epimerase
MSQMPPVHLSQIGQVALPIDNLDRAVAFYRDCLGLPFLFQVPNLAFFDCAGVRLMLSRPENGAAERPGSVLYFTVVDIQDAYQALQALDVPFVDQPHVVARLGPNDLWMAFFTDPDANMLAIMSEAPHVEPGLPSSA